MHASAYYACAVLAHDLSLMHGIPHACTQVTNALLKVFAEDDDKDVVASASEGLSEIATGLGPAGCNLLAPKLTAICIKLLKQKHPCFEEDADDVADGLDPDADHDGALWEAVSELLTNLPKVRVHAAHVHPVE